ncbi:MAG: tetratricopeptide repeat protein [Solidesulfovibrio sp.]|uniref:tetratricopeptide repeat protein n=1 Tax=Solidesulfovibrio sp. TaxID=2910990 RepID=UPI003157F9FC
MPELTKRAITGRLPLLLVLALLPCLLSNSCASSRPARLAYAGKALSPQAEGAYQFLVYQDLLRQGKKDEAAQVLAGLNQSQPSPETAVELANLLWGQNEREAATRTLETAAAAFPDSRQLVLYLASAYQMRRLPDAAVAALERFVTGHPGDAQALRELASLLEESGRHQEALDALSRIPEDGRDATTLYLMAKATAGLDRKDAAIALLRRAVAADAALTAAWTELGALLEEKGDLAGAEDCYRKMLAQDEDSPEVRAKLARVLIRQKKPDRAVKYLEEGPPDKARLLDAMSALLEAGYVKQARQVLARLAAAIPDSPDLPFYQAVIAYEGEKKPKEALAILAKVPPENPNFDKALSFRIQLTSEMGDLSGAQALAAEARKRFPDRKEFPALEAALLDKRGETAKASAILKDAVAAWPDDMDLLYRYGVSLEKLKRRDEAKAVMENIVAKDPTNPDALNYLGYSLTEEGKDLEKALGMIRTALAKEPDNPFFLDSLAWTLHKLGRNAEALAAIERAIGHNVKDAVIWEHYGDITAAAGRKAEAQKAYRTALELGSDNPGDVKKKLGAL